MPGDIEYDLIVNDENCEAAGKEYIRRAENFENMILQYESILTKLLSEGIKSGKVHDNLKLYSEIVATLKTEVKELATKAQECNRGFITDMDTADSYLY